MILKNFQQKSKRGKRNTLILYGLITLFLIVIIILCGNFRLIDENDELGLYEGNDELVATAVPALPTPDISNENTIPETNSESHNIITTSDSLVDEDTFLKNMLSLLNETSQTATNELITYAIGLSCGEVTKNDFQQVSQNDLKVGDIAVNGDNIGIYLGKYQEHSVVLNISSIGNIVEFNIPRIALSYILSECDSMCLTYFPVDFTEFYHCSLNTYSSGTSLEQLIESTVSYDKKYTEFADRCYQLFSMIKNYKYSGIQEQINVSYLQNQSYEVNPDLLIKYINDFTAGIEVGDGTDSYISFTDIYASSNCYLISFKISLCDEENELNTLREDCFTLFNDGTFLPYNIYIPHINLEEYGIVHLNTGESLASPENYPESFSTENGSLVQNENEEWIYRKNGVDINLSQFYDQNNIVGTEEESKINEEKEN